MDKITCNLTEDKIKVSMEDHGRMLHDDNHSARIDRINYLNKRLISKGKSEEPKAEQQAAPTGWGANG